MQTNGWSAWSVDLDKVSDQSVSLHWNAKFQIKVHQLLFNSDWLVFFFFRTANDYLLVRTYFCFLNEQIKYLQHEYPFLLLHYAQHSAMSLSGRFVLSFWLLFGFFFFTFLGIKIWNLWWNIIRISNCYYTNKYFYPPWYSEASIRRLLFLLLIAKSP